jgi:hypothetical protein
VVQTVTPKRVLDYVQPIHVTVLHAMIAAAHGMTGQHVVLHVMERKLDHDIVDHLILNVKALSLKYVEERVLANHLHNHLHAMISVQYGPIGRIVLRHAVVELNRDRDIALLINYLAKHMIPYHVLPINVVTA